MPGSMRSVTCCSCEPSSRRYEERPRTRDGTPRRGRRDPKPRRTSSSPSGTGGAREFVQHSLGRHAEAVAVMDAFPPGDARRARGVREPGALPFLPDLIQPSLSSARWNAPDRWTIERGPMSRAKRSTGARARHRRAVSSARGRARRRPRRCSTRARRRRDTARSHRDAVRARRMLLVRGDILRREQKRRREESLDQAARIFETLGAPMWLEKARSALSRVGGRAGAASTLDGDRAAGRGSRRGGAEEQGGGRPELFISVKTVEANLHRIYQKLGVRSRTELAGLLLAADAEGPTRVPIHSSLRRPLGVRSRAWLGAQTDRRSGPRFRSPLPSSPALRHRRSGRRSRWIAAGPMRSEHGRSLGLVAVLGVALGGLLGATRSRALRPRRGLTANNGRPRRSSARSRSPI